MTHYEGLLLDFGGVVTTDFLAALAPIVNAWACPTTASATSSPLIRRVVSCTTKWNAER